MAITDTVQHVKSFAEMQGCVINKVFLYHDRLFITMGKGFRGENDLILKVEVEAMTDCHCDPDISISFRDRKLGAEALGQAGVNLGIYTQAEYDSLLADQRRDQKARRKELRRKEYEELKKEFGDVV